MIIFEGDSFKIRELEETDAEPLFTNYHSCPVSARYVSTRVHIDTDQTLQAIRRWRMHYRKENPSLLVYGITTEHTDEPVGVLVLVWQTDHAEIHFGLSSACSGKGLATKVCSAGLKLLHSKGVRDVRTQPYIGHKASIRVLKKCSFVDHGRLKQHAPFPALGDGLFDCADMRLQLEPANTGSSCRTENSNRC
ncbi:GNAT family N-acetyltransferase [Parendozoicomonas haliclonae]|uniref:N-acetyltransferase domain-containing protein n=1 Tax=Parendozoicomonas haliclonae TaxID=1960125 RepID=A0A1X7ARC4_9GAMM|nr:GNAT family protein [Parendozoicomonas haliclonae]SMA50692.1 hypothetical protein EHSB41UT_04509 [Parendozoicomonas haliclonae]